MVDLRAKPFYLNEQEIRWVEDTIASMSLDEKLSQLFVLLKGIPGADEGMIRGLMESVRPGGCAGRARRPRAALRRGGEIPL